MSKESKDYETIKNKVVKELKEIGVSDDLLAHRAASRLIFLLEKENYDELNSSGQKAIDLMVQLADVFTYLQKYVLLAESFAKDFELKITKGMDDANKFMKAFDGLTEIDSTNKAIYLYYSMLETTKNAFGDKLSDEVMTAAINAGSTGVWRSIMGESKPLAITEKKQ